MVDAYLMYFVNVRITSRVTVMHPTISDRYQDDYAHDDDAHVAEKVAYPHMPTEIHYMPLRS